jgi:hypothetical protein
MILVDYKLPGGDRRACLVLKEGRLFMHVLVLDNPMRVQRVRLDEGKYMRVMPYNLKRALKVYRRCARNWYGSVAEIPKSVKQAIKG